VKPEIGIVNSLKQKEFGFIKAVERKDDIFFRFADLQNEADIERLEEVSSFFLSKDRYSPILCCLYFHSLSFSLFFSSFFSLFFSQGHGGGVLCDR
jgi:hypothetical protein